MKVGITGGNGFIGTHARRSYEARRHNVGVFDLPRNVALAADYGQLSEFVADSDVVLHLAGTLGTEEQINDPGPAIRTNIIGTYNVLEACRHYGTPLVFATVGNVQMINTYATTKLCAERLVMQYRDEFGLLATVVRPMNAYGPGQKAAAPFGASPIRKAMVSFILHGLTSTPITLYNGGDQLADMVYVGDVTDTFLAAAERLLDGDVPNWTVEVGSIEHYSVKQIVGLVLDETERRGAPRPEVMSGGQRPGEQLHSWLNEVEVESVVEYAVGLGAPLPLARQIVKPLSNRVVADTDTLAQVGIDPRLFVALEDGICRAVNWYVANEGAAWSRPSAG